MLPGHIVTGQCYSATFGCGVLEFYEFATEHVDDVGHFTDYSAHCGNLENIVVADRGAGFGIASFINTAACRDAYEVLKKRFKITYQSPVRRNANSGNRFFFCCYDLR